LVIRNAMSNYTEHADEQLLIGVTQGDEHAFTILYNKHYASVYYFTKRIVGEELAKDIVIEVFTKWWQHKEELKTVGHLVAYLRTLARNACIDHLRRLKTENARQQELLHLTDDRYEEIYFRDVLEAHLFTIIQQEIEQLPKHLRDIFKLAYYEGLKNPEIAERLHIKDTTVRVGKAEAIKLLRTALLRTDLPLMIVYSFYLKKFL